MTTPIETDIPGLFALPLPTPFPVGRINTYVALGDGLTLIDTGVNSDQSYDELVEGLSALGVKAADLERILITHHHTDHLGGVSRLAEESGAEVWCHARCVPYVERPAEARQHMRDWGAQLWQESGVPPALADLIGQLYDWFNTFTNRPVAVTRALEDGDTLDLLGEAWTVLHTPGHAGDLICLHQSERGVLLSSDHLIRDISSNALIEPPLPGQKRPRRLLEYMVQLQRVADLAPRTAYAGHGEPVTDVAGLVAERLAFHRERADKLLAILAGQPGAISLYALTEIMFAHVSEGEKFLALSEVLGHLDWLERDGRVARTEHDGRVLWLAPHPSPAPAE